MTGAEVTTVLTAAIGLAMALLAAWHARQARKSAAAARVAAAKVGPAVDRVDPRKE